MFRKKERRSLLAIILLTGATWGGFLAAQEFPKPSTPPAPNYGGQPSIFGLLPRPTDESGLQPAGGMAILSPPPPAWDWRAHGGVTPIRDQNPYGACWAFAAAGEMESMTLIREQTAYDFSEYNLIACNPFGAGCNSGGNDYLAAVFWTRTGTVAESCDLYSQCAGALTCHSTCPRLTTPLGWRYLANNVAEIRDMVYNQGPVYTSIYAGDTLLPADSVFLHLAAGQVYYWTGAQAVNHAVVIVGYDDNKVHAGGKGAWLVRNSWGTWWADGGYGWVAYGSARIGQEASAYTDYQSANPDEEIYFYDERGCDSSLGYGSDTAWGMIKVTPSHSGFLRRVEFWTTAINAVYSINVYDVLAGSTLSNLLTFQDGACTQKGYYSVALTSPVKVTAGNDIFIAIEFITPGFNSPVPLDYFGPHETNRCFISPNGANWSAYNDHDVAIRARLAIDADYDGLSDRLENLGCTSSVNPDTDGDGLCDGNTAVRNGPTLICAAGEDLDADGVRDATETNPCAADTDGDGLNDGSEILTHHTNPLVVDTDRDGVADGAEVNTYATNPLAWDSDADSLPDGFEIAHLGSSPALSPNNAADGLADFDTDGNPNREEYWNGSDPWTNGSTGFAGCSYWGDSGAGDGIVGPSDAVELQKAIIGLAANYAGVVPNTGETQELSMNGIVGPEDFIILQKMVLSISMPSLPSRPVAIDVLESPGAPVLVGNTCHVTVAVRNEAGLVTPGLGVVFAIVSGPGTATLYGGEGAAAPGQRYDISGSVAGPAGRARIVLRVNSPGAITLSAAVPTCGAMPNGRSCPDIVVNPAAVMVGQ